MAIMVSSEMSGPCVNPSFIVLHRTHDIWDESFILSQGKKCEWLFAAQTVPVMGIDKNLTNSAKASSFHSGKLEKFTSLG